MAIYCSSCGAPNFDGAGFCTTCGAMPLTSAAESPSTGRPVSAPQSPPPAPPPPPYEPGVNLRQTSQPLSAPPQPPIHQPPSVVYQQPVYINQPVVVAANKSKLTAGLLALFLGGLGIHRFYLGHNGIGVTQLLLCLAGWLTCGLTTAVVLIWSLIDAILIFTGSISTDAQGHPLI
jgi:TM2 domain-containing membrane protein YozV